MALPCGLAGAQAAIARRQIISDWLAALWPTRPNLSTSTPSDWAGRSRPEISRSHPRVRRPCFFRHCRWLGTRLALLLVVFFCCGRRRLPFASVGETRRTGLLGPPIHGQVYVVALRNKDRVARKIALTRCAKDCAVLLSDINLSCFCF